MGTDNRVLGQEAPSGKKEKWFTLKQKLVLAVPVNAFAALSVLFFAPLEIYLGNINEFNFPFNHIWWILLLCSTLLAAGGTAVECLLPDRLFLIANIGIFALALCCYIQAMFLNGQMGTLTGETKTYGVGIILINLLIWILIISAIVALAVILIQKKKRQFFTGALTFVSLALIAMQTTALVTLLVSTDTYAFQKDDYLTSEGQFELASQNNVIVFILDTLDMSFMQTTLKRYPDVWDNFDGFTYYPNTTSTHSRTYPSITYLLTGEICYFDVPYKEYVNKAFEESSFLPRIYDAGTDIRLFTESPFIGNAIKNKVMNCTAIRQNDLSAISIPGLLEQMLKISLYRELPYFAKSPFQYDTSEVNYAVSNSPADSSEEAKQAEPYIPEDDALFFERFKEQGLSVSEDYEKAFRFYHLNGAHLDANINQDGERVEKHTDRFQAVRGDFHIIESYIKQLQAKGLYKDSTIIITADHGMSVANSWEEMEISGVPCITTLIKAAGKDEGDPFQVSDAPVSHMDLFPTILAAYGLDPSDFGRPISEIAENEQRERPYYLSVFLDDADGEIVLREYSVGGDARKRENWKLTGRYWDIQYSQRPVSKKRFEDFQK